MSRCAIEFALDLARMPALARSCGSMPLPTDVLDAMKLAAGDENVCRSAMQATRADRATLVAAARFYMQHLLFHPDADSYRTLGLLPDASVEEARVHMAVLLQWLHPDRNQELESLYAERVLRAWRIISRREEPTMAQRVKAGERKLKTPTWKLAPPLIARPRRAPPRSRSSGSGRRATYFALAFIACLAVYYFTPQISEILALEMRP